MCFPGSLLQQRVSELVGREPDRIHTQSHAFKLCKNKAMLYANRAPIRHDLCESTTIQSTIGILHFHRSGGEKIVGAPVLGDTSSQRR